MARFEIFVCVVAFLVQGSRGEREYIRGSAVLGWDPNNFQYYQQNNSFRDDNRFAFTPCYRDDSEADGCLKELFQRMLPDLADGYEPYGLPPADPLSVKSVTFAYASSLLGGAVDVSNVETRGFSGAHIMDLKANVMDADQIRITVDALYPRVEADGNYKIAGNIAQIPIKTNGNWSVVFENVTVPWEIKGVPMQKDDKVVLNITRFGFMSQPEMPRFKVHATNIIPGNTELNDFALQFINHNWKVIYNQMYPFMETKISDDVMIEWANIGLRNIPFDTLLPLGKKSSQ